MAILLRNIYGKTIRDNRSGLLGWGLGIATIMGVGASQYGQIISGTPEERRRIAAETVKAFEGFSFLIGDIVGLDTIGGFITTRVMGFIPVMIGLWAIVLAVGVLRGEEQNGSMDVVLAAPHSRVSVALQKIAAVLTAVLVVCALAGLGLWAGVLASAEQLAVGDIALAMLNVFVISAFWAGVGLLVSQFVVIRRTASSMTGGLMFATFLVNNLLSGNEDLEWAAWLMPFHWYSASKPMAPGYGQDWSAFAIMAVAALVVMLAAVWIFVRRDVGESFTALPASSQRTARGGSPLLLGSVFGKSIRDLVWPTVWWAVGLSAYVVMIVGTVNQVLEPLRDVLSNLGWMAAIVGNMATPAAYLGYSLFTFLPVLLAVHAITQINSWSDDEEEGRLEVLAAMPLPRWMLLVPRYVALAASMLAIVLFVYAAIAVSAPAFNVTLDTGQVLLALLAAVPVGLVVAAFGLLVATWLKRPGLAVPITVTVVVAMFFLQLFGPVFELPEAVLNLSIFQLYGRPLTDGIEWRWIGALAAATLLFAVGSLVGLQRRDIAK
jgi:ABC-2 type transport system permease protein